MAGMSDASTPPRPRQVTLAAWLIMLGSVVVVLTVYDRIAALHSLDSKAAVERLLAQPPARDLGLGVQQVLQVVRVLALVAAGCATAAAILGYHVLRRSRSARVALAVLAVPLLVSGTVVGGFMSSVVAAAAAMLWFPPSRDWFRDGPRPTPAAPAPGGVAPQAAARPAVHPAAHPAAHPEARRMLPEVATDPDVRPPAVVWACVLTWVCSTLALLSMGASMVVLAADPHLLLDEMARQDPELARQGITAGTLQATAWGLSGAVVAWSLVAIVLAALVWRGSGRARAALVVSTGCAAGVLLVATLGQVLLVLPLGACVVALALLVRPDVRAWFDRPRDA